MDQLDFLVRVKGLDVSVTLLSEVPTGSTPVWDFGVINGQVESENSYTYHYETSGRYTITLYLKTNGTITKAGSRIAMATAYANTQLTDSIYRLIDKYIPEELIINMSFDDKSLYINKWQLYMQPLVNHEVPIEEYSNELYYEGLENQLIMEMAVYDFLYTRLQSMLIQTAGQLKEMVSGSESETTVDGSGARDRIKQITTGPTEVQYYDTVTESVSSLFKAYTTATQPGGILDDLRKNLCMLSKRLDIYLPICTNDNIIKVPKVVNRRNPGPIDGPNPGSLVNIPKESIL